MDLGASLLSGIGYTGASLIPGLRRIQAYITPSAEPRRGSTTAAASVSHVRGVNPRVAPDIKTARTPANQITSRPDSGALTAITLTHLTGTKCARWYTYSLTEMASPVAADTLKPQLSLS